MNHSIMQSEHLEHACSSLLFEPVDNVIGSIGSVLGASTTDHFLANIICLHDQLCFIVWIESRNPLSSSLRQKKRERGQDSESENDSQCITM